MISKLIIKARVFLNADFQVPSSKKYQFIQTFELSILRSSRRKHCTGAPLEDKAHDFDHEQCLVTYHPGSAQDFRREEIPARYLAWPTEPALPIPVSLTLLPSRQSAPLGIGKRFSIPPF